MLSHLNLLTVQQEVEKRMEELRWWWSVVMVEGAWAAAAVQQS